MRKLLLAAVMMAGCSGDKDLATPDECNPLGGVACMTPWPSSVYETDDSTTATGRRLDIPKGALPTNYDDTDVDPALYNTHDGFSSAAPIVMAFETGVDPSNLPTFHDFEASVADSSPTVLIDMSTGELVHHFAEVDVRGADKPGSQALFIRSTQMLEGGTRYAVAIKKTLKAKNGGALPISEGFAALVSGETTSHPLLEKIRPRYAAIFAALEAHGIAKDDLVVAWDFTTRSRESVQRDLLEARRATLGAIGPGASNLTYEVLTTEAPTGDARIAKKIQGTYFGPMFMENASTRDDGTVFATPGMTLARDGGNGAPSVVGVAKWPFTVIIPQCALDSATPVPLILYGHGLLGQDDQVASGGMRAATSEICAVGIGTDMFGMSDQDVPNVALALNDANNGHLIFDTLVQGMMNHVTLVQIAKGPMLNALFAKEGGGSLIDPTKIYYYGISQGGIMGTTVCAIDPVIKRCVLQVCAINYSLLLERSRDWPRYATTLEGAYADPLVGTLILNLMQQEWDRTEPTAVADSMTHGGFPETPEKQVLMQIAIGDDEVSNLGAEYQARTMGVPVITPSPSMPWGIANAASSTTSGMIYYDFGVGGTIPDTNEAPPDNDVHSQIRNKKFTTDMMKHFYETGEIKNVCTAPNGCDCTVAGACGDTI
jgi:hypothetical protein